MNRYDFYSGEPVSSPDFISQNTTNMSNIVENTGQAIQYSYDPNMRYSQMMQQNQQQNMYYPGGYGYNQPYNSYQQQMPFMNPPINPYQPQQYPYGNGIGFAGNPAIDYLNQINKPLNLNFEDRVVHVDGFNTGSNMLLSPDAEDICNKLQLEMMAEQEEAIEKRNQRFQGYFNNNGYYNNYYGMPYMSTWQDQTVTMKYRRMIDEMKQEAVEKRKNFNKRLSKLTHNYLNDNISEDDIDMIYDGYSYTIPGVTMRCQSECDRFSRMVPVSNQAAYINHYNEVTKMYDTLLPQNCNMQEFLHQQGVLQIYYNLEDEYHRRRDVSQFYQGDSYKRFLRKAVRNRDGGVPQNNNSQLNPQLNNYPLLSNNAQVLDDGSISITAPSWMGGGQTHIQFNNELEQHFEENRHRFLQSIYAQEGMTNGA